MLVWEDAITLVAYRMKLPFFVRYSGLEILGTVCRKGKICFAGAILRKSPTWFFGSLGLMITDSDRGPPLPPKEDVDNKQLPALIRKRGEGIVVTSSPRRSERPDAMAQTEQQAIATEQSQRLLTLGSIVQMGVSRQGRLGGTSPDIAGSLKTVRAKMTTTRSRLVAT